MERCVAKFLGAADVVDPGTVAAADVVDPGTVAADVVDDDVEHGNTAILIRNSTLHVGHDTIGPASSAEPVARPLDPLVRTTLNLTYIPEWHSGQTKRGI